MLEPWAEPAEDAVLLKVRLRRPGLRPKVRRAERHSHTLPGALVRSLGPRGYHYGEYGQLDLCHGVLDSQCDYPRN